MTVNNTQNHRRAAKLPNRVARSNLVESKRVLRSTTRIFAQTANTAQDGVEGFFGFGFQVDEFVGSDFISDNFEQFRVDRIKLIMKPSTGQLSAPTDTASSILYQNSVYSLMNGTEVETYIDYDSSVAPGNYNALLSRPNLKIRALKPNNWTMIANYVPKTVTNPSNNPDSPTITWASNIWLSTRNMDVPFRGLQGRISNRAPVFGTQDNVVTVDVIVTLELSMRGPKNGLGSASSTSGLPQLSASLLPRANSDVQVTDGSTRSGEPIMSTSVDETRLY